MINKLLLKNVRLFSSFDLDVKKNIVVFIGDNATGKTTILESIYFLCLTKSPRTLNEKELVKFNEPFCKMTMLADKEYTAVIGEEKKILIDKKEIKKYKDYIGLNNVVMFSPNDMQLVYGSPSERRRFLDINISQVSKKYLVLLSEYKKYLKQRNDLLKKLTMNDDMIFLDIITSKLLEVAKEIINFRIQFVNELNEKATKVSDEKIEIIYQQSTNKLEETMRNKREMDILTKTTNYGPHRDDLFFKLNGKNSSFCSQGQIRTIVLEMKLTLIKIIMEYKKTKPVVLLDDVLSELDDKRKNNLFSILNDDYQVFITSTDVLNINKDLLKKAQVINLKERGNLNG